MKERAFALIFLIILLVTPLSSASFWSWITGKAAAEAKPDLVIDSIQINPTNPVVNEEVTFKVTIKNNGDAEVGSGSSMVVYVSPEGQTPFTSEAIGRLGVGDTVTPPTEGNPVIFSSEGNYKVNVKVDPNNAIDESDETNNEKEITLYVAQKITAATETPVTATPAPPAISINATSTTPAASYVPVTEKVECTFIDPDPMLKHSCGTSGGSCTWIWDGIKTEARDERMGPLLEKEINGEKVKYATCTAEVIGAKGENKNWRSTCGGEANTTMDGTDEKIEFKCLSDRQVDITQLSGRGFEYVMWWCQGGTGAALGSETACKTADAWKKLAEEYCANSCHTDILGKEKCGLYSFSVSKECYFATEAERQEAETMPMTGKELKMRKAAWPKMRASVLIYSYLGDCPECAELENETDRLSLKTEDRAKTTDFRYANFNYKRFLDTYPNENVLLYLDIMTETNEGETNAYARVYERPGKVDYKTAEDWWLNQVLTREVEPVYDTLSAQETGAPKILKKDFLLYYYLGDCPECEQLKNIQADIGEKPVVVSTESSGKTSMSLAVAAALKSFLEEHKDENYLIYGMYSGDNELTLYAKAGKAADYLETADWIRQIRAGKLSPIASVEKTEEEVKKQLGQPTTGEKEEVLICKDSCPIGGKCAPFGYRKAGKYCSDTGAFKEQLKEDEACENNFECSSNVCINGNCISGSLIQEILEWFKKLFGG